MPHAGWHPLDRARDDHLTVEAEALALPEALHDLSITFNSEGDQALRGEAPAIERRGEVNADHLKASLFRREIDRFNGRDRLRDRAREGVKSCRRPARARG
jgi:hypothetical protein